MSRRRMQLRLMQFHLLKEDPGQLEISTPMNVNNSLKFFKMIGYSNCLPTYGRAFLYLSPFQCFVSMFSPGHLNVINVL